jgi:hypothetical protein
MAKVSSDKAPTATKKAGGRGKKPSSALGGISSSSPTGGKVDGNPTPAAKKGSPSK